MKDMKLFKEKENMTCKELYAVLEGAEPMECSVHEQQKFKVGLIALNKINDVVDKVLLFNEPTNIPKDSFLMTTQELSESLKDRESDLIEDGYVYLTAREMIKVKDILEKIISIDSEEEEHEVTEKSPLGDSWYCPACGEYVEEDMNFCPHCRVRLSWSN